MLCNSFTKLEKQFNIQDFFTILVIPFNKKNDKNRYIYEVQRFSLRILK